MNDRLDDQLRRLMTEIDAAAPAARGWEAVSQRTVSRPVRWLAPVIGLAAVVVSAIVVAVLVLPGDEPSRVVTVPPEPTSAPRVTPEPSAPPATDLRPSTSSTPATVPPIELSADTAVALAAPGKVDALAVLDRIPVAGVVVIGDCDDDGGCSMPPFEDEHVPANPTEIVATLNYIDVDAALGVLGVDRTVAQRVPPDEWPLTTPWPSWLGFPRFFRGGDDDPERQRAEVGFATMDILRAAEVRVIPDRTSVLDVAVPPATIDAAVRSDPQWSGDLAVVDTDAGSYYDWDADRPPLSQDLAHTSPMRELGVGGQLHVSPADDGSHVTRTLRPETVEAAMAGAPSIVDTGPYAAAIALLPDARIIQLAGGYHQVAYDDTDWMTTTIDRYLVRMSAVSVDGSGLRRDIYVVYDDPVTAAANLDRIATITRDGLPADPEIGGSGSEPIPDATVTLTGNVIHVATRDIDASLNLPVPT